MGGYRSNRWGNYKRKVCVEECSVISINRLQEEICQVNKNSISISGVTEFHRNLTVNNFIYWRIKKNNAGMNLEIRFHVPLINDEITQFIDLDNSIINRGGLRWYFLCPGMKNDNKCNHRGTKLYRPQFSSKYLCRSCYDLSYKRSIISRNKRKYYWKNRFHITILRS